MSAARLYVEGIVQGVGFRPFVYRTALKYSLKGYVKNLGDAGVEIWIEGDKNQIKNFIDDLKTKSPPLAKVENINIKYEKDENFEIFKILPSSSSRYEGDSIIPPDVAICDDCLRELFDPSDPRYMYPFIVCTNCGPRFSIIESLPYDRNNTTMKDFPMCKFCKTEYEDPLNRRYHAEPVCCDRCGPHYILLDKYGNHVLGDPLKKAAELIDNGQIIAIKGIGGFHIACDAFNENSIKSLRRRLRRENQPFAIMVKDLQTVRKIAYLSNSEKSELKSYRRPIVLLRKKINMRGIAPGLHTIGIMLPYAGVHYILFHYSSTKAYVMTSANYPDFPMIKDNTQIHEIKGVVDYFLIHNRDIINRIDDSVIRFHGNKRAIIRRSRGFVPLPIKIPFKYKGIAMGAELMNSFSLIKGNRVYSSQYIGNTSKLEVINFQRDAIEKMRKIVGIKKYDLVIVDSHPLYNTSKEGEKINADLLKVQHHFAHIAGIMAEYQIDEIIGIAIDAIGYGLDGKTWGGEILTLGEGIARRESHISYFPLPGGDLASHYPLRALIGVLSQIYTLDEIDTIIHKICPKAINSLPYGEKEFEIILNQVKRNLNISEASSLGRVLDSIAVLLNIAYQRTYEGEPAMKLESFAMGGMDLRFDIPDDRNINIAILFEEILASNAKLRDIAYSVHMAIARAFADRAVRVSEERGIKNIGVAGGVAYNEIIIKEIERFVKSHNLKFFVSVDVPRGDNGISIGQAYLGGMYLKSYLKKSDIGGLR